MVEVDAPPPRAAGTPWRRGRHPGRGSRTVGGGAGGGSRRARPRRKLLVIGALVVALVLALSAKLFVWPADSSVQGAHADAILVMNGPGPRWAVAARLVAERAAPVVFVSTKSVRWDCPDWGVPGVTVQCFRPVPFDTRGEARYVAREANAHGWHSLIVVSSIAQATRARLRVERCFTGSVKVVVAVPSWPTWAYEVLYEWGALVKALVWQRGC